MWCQPAAPSCAWQSAFWRPRRSALLEIANLLGRFRSACPHVENRPITGGSMKLIEGVGAGELTLALVQFVGAALPGPSALWCLIAARKRSIRVHSLHRAFADEKIQ